MGRVVKSSQPLGFYILEMGGDFPKYGIYSLELSMGEQPDINQIRDKIYNTNK